MTGMRSVALLGFAGLLLGLFGGCKGDGSTVDANAGASSGASSGGSQPNLSPLGGTTNDPSAGASAGGADAGPAVEECESFEELADCGTTSVEASFSAANVLLVIDKSSSMDDQPEGFELKKWEALKTALESALTEVAEEMSFGLLLYPFGETTEIPLDCFEGCCEVPRGPAAIRVGIAPGERSVPQVMEALNDTAPGGGTPTANALKAAYTYFTLGEGKNLKGDRIVLLATDGGPNCGPDNTCDAARCTPNLDGLCSAGNCCEGEGLHCLDDAAVVEQIEALASEGVPTFVIGIPGTEDYWEYLDAFAAAGGVPNPAGPREYYAVSAEGGVDGLTQTFIDITTHLIRSCEVELGSAPSDVNRVNVAVDCELVPYEDGAGWSITDAGTLILAGDACAKLEREGARRVDVVYGCQQVK